MIDLLDGTDSTYKRKLAVYQASDNPTGNRDGRHALEGIGTRCAFFKLDQVNIDGLRQCLADPDVRIRQDYEYEAATYPRIEKVKIIGGFLDGAEAIFHEGLNSVLGAKGAGKSLLIEFLRFALNQPPSNDEIRTDHESKLENRLENYGSVELVVVDETGQAFTITRTWDPADDHPYGGEIQHPAETFPILFLSQNEIIKIAESESEQMAFIDRFFDFRSYQQEIADLDHRLEELDSMLGETFRAFRAQSEIEQRIAAATKEIETLDKALKNPIFDQYSKSETKDRALRDQKTFLENLIRQWDATHKEYSRIQLPAVPETCADDPAVKRALDAISKAKDVLLEGCDHVDGKIAALKQQVEDEYGKWSPQFQSAKKNYNDAVQKEGGDYRNLAQKLSRIAAGPKTRSRSRTPGTPNPRPDQGQSFEHRLLHRPRSLACN